MIEILKVMLIPNNKQKSKLVQLAGVARFAYNWALDREQEIYNRDGTFLDNRELRNEFTRLKSTEKYKWLYNYSNNTTKQAIKDACLDWEKFLKWKSDYPKFKSKKTSQPSFYVDIGKIKFTDRAVKLEKLTLSRKRNRQKFNWIRLAERNRIPLNTRHFNPRIFFDGINWWISVGIQVANSEEKPNNDGIGIAVGVKNLAVCSDIDKPYKNINKTQKIKKLKKKQRRLKRKLSKKYLMNKQGENHSKTSNIIKAEKKLLKLNQRLKNIRHNYLHQVTTEIVNRKPRFIVLDKLDVNAMRKNKHLSEKIAEQCLTKFYKQMEYNARYNNIKFIIADWAYPSSKICSGCGNVKKDLNLSDRIYECDNCNVAIDIDKNASITLYNYGKSVC